MASYNIYRKDDNLFDQVCYNNLDFLQSQNLIFFFNTNDSSLRVSDDDNQLLEFLISTKKNTLEKSSIFPNINDNNSCFSDSNTNVYNKFIGDEKLSNTNDNFINTETDQSSMCEMVDSNNLNGFETFNDFLTDDLKNYSMKCLIDSTDNLSLKKKVNFDFKSNGNSPSLYDHISIQNFFSKPKIKFKNKKTSVRNKVKKLRPKGSKNNFKIDLKISYENISTESVFDYEESKKIYNIAKNPTPFFFEEIYQKKIIKDLSKFSSYLDHTFMRRTLFHRPNLIYDFSKHHRQLNIVYQNNHNFKKNFYEPEYVRVHIDSINSKPFNHTRCGLCPYCKEIRFFNFKTSAYGQHLALQHGIYTDGFLTPNPIKYGYYRLTKSENRPNSQRKNIAHEHKKYGIVCPCCYMVVELACTSNTNSKPLINYLRHFRDLHIYVKNKNNSSQFFCKMENPDLFLTQ